MYAADLHIHSKYSRATSGDCVPAMLDLWARRKGIGLLGTGDFTHPAWRQMLAGQLEPAEEGLYTLKDEFRAEDPFAPPGAQRPRFVVSGEISSIYKQDGRVRKVHSVILLPSLEKAEALSARLEAIGNIHSDGRPILGLSARDLLAVTLEVCPEAVFIPAHIWTPHFSLFGAMSGFDTMEECFGDLAPYIHALETGLSSDPVMNRRLSALDGYTLVSNSDAHSPARLGRELNLIGGELSFGGMKRAVEGGAAGGFAGTVEFFPEEGKYHLDGHRNCGVCLEPEEAARLDNQCPVCGKRLTMGVYHRIVQLADRSEVQAAQHLPLPFERLVPLQEVIASVSGMSASGAKAQARYEALIHALGSELNILRDLPVGEIAAAAGAAVAEGVRRMRAGEVQLQAGFDGEYGKVNLMNADEIAALSGQISFLDALLPPKPAKKAAPHTEPVKPAVKTAVSVPAAAAGLNEEQKAAVEAQERTVAVIAGPGSGKTGTLIARIAYLIDSGVKPDKICAVTFTNKAANELRERLARRFGSRKAIQGLTVGTFHSVSLNLLRRTQPYLTVLDEAGCLSLAGDIANALALSMSPQRVAKEIAVLRAGGQSELPVQAYELWKSRLAALDAATFDDLLLTELNDPLAPPFEHLLVDEYQDVSDVQRALVSKWNAGGGSLFVIGDPDQSIYGFRGADADCFGRLLADRPDARVIALKMNYRSAPEILACALPLIEQNGGKRGLQAGRSPGGCVKRVNVTGEYAEGIYIAKEIGRMVGGMDMLESAESAGRQTGFADVAVLCRTHRQMDTIEKCLAAEGIPCVVTGREEYLSAPEAAKAIAFLRLALNPDDRSALEALPEADRPAALELARACAGKAERNKPVRLLEKWKKLRACGPDEALERLMQAAAAAQDTAALLNDVMLGSEGDLTRSGGRKYTAEAVRIMTLHGSKGLEFPVVFIAGVKQGVLPLITPYGAPTDLSEERRLLYVGMTRAKDELILLAHPEESVLLRDIPPETMRHEQAHPQPRPETARQLTFL